jgi:hypothetical protein
VSWWNFFKKKEPPPPPAPKPEPLPDDEKHRRLAELVKLADKAYDDMYEARNPTGAYSDMKDLMIDAIAFAEELGLKEKAAELRKTLEHRKAVFRSQFS